jgi:FkbM family methyltransferase
LLVSEDPFTERLDRIFQYKGTNMKKAIKSLLGHLGYRISKIDPNRLPTKNMKSVIESISKKHQIGTIIDVGASNGVWSRAALDYFPHPQYLLLEAQPAHRESLTAFVAKNRNAEFVLAAAGEQRGEIYFLDAPDRESGRASYTPLGEHNIIVPVTTIDDEVELRTLQGPYLIKLDTHGFEVPILKGASRTLLNTEVLIVECYNFKISPECLLFYEMCNYLDRLGFRCVDLADPLWRPYDLAFWQMDLVFVKKDRQEFSYLGYR